MAQSKDKVEKEESGPSGGGEVGRWLAGLGLQSELPKFLDNGVTTMQLVRFVTEEDLQSWGVKSVPRRAMLAAIKKLTAAPAQYV